MARLQKEKTLLKRDEKGNLVPVEVTLETLEASGEEPEEILITPMPPGELNRLFAESKKQSTTASQDNKIIETHCIEPKYSKEEIEDLHFSYKTAIVLAIMSLSTRIPQKELKDKSMQVLRKRFESQQEEVKKN